MHRREAAFLIRRIARDTSRENVHIASTTNGLLHTGNFLASPSMHGPGGQSSGTPVVTQTVKKQPSRDNPPSKGEQTVKDSPASQGSKADTTASSNSSNVSSPKSAATVTDGTIKKGFHTIRSIALSTNTHITSFHAMRRLSAGSNHTGNFELRDQNDTSRDTAAAAEAKNAEKGVASGSTRKDASDTGRPSEAAPTASESVPRNVKEQGLHGNVKDAQGSLQDTKNQQVGKDSPGGPKLLHTSA